MCASGVCSIRFEREFNHRFGAMAQLVAHLHGMEGVGGSNPPSSTMNRSSAYLRRAFLFLPYKTRPRRFIKAPAASSTAQATNRGGAAHPIKCGTAPAISGIQLCVCDSPWFGIRPVPYPQQPRLRRAPCPALRERRSFPHTPCRCSRCRKDERRTSCPWW